MCKSVSLVGHCCGHLSVCCSSALLNRSLWYGGVVVALLDFSTSGLLQLVCSGGDEGATFHPEQGCSRHSSRTRAVMSGETVSVSLRVNCWIVGLKSMANMQKLAESKKAKQFPRLCLLLCMVCRRNIVCVVLMPPLRYGRASRGTDTSPNLWVVDSVSEGALALRPLVQPSINIGHGNSSVG